MSMLDIILNHLVDDITGGPHEIADSPKVSAPVAFAKFWKFLLDFTRSLTFEILYQLAYGQIRRDRDVDMDMVLRDPTSDDFNLIFTAYLTYQIAGAGTNVTNENRVAVFRDPNNVVGTVKCGVAGLPIVLHIPAILSC